MDRIKDYVLNSTIAPKWLIFLLDSIIGAVGVVTAYMLRFNFDIEYVMSLNIFDDIFVVVLTNSLFFYIFRTYQGIIRFSGFAEALRTTTALLCTFMLLTVVNIFLAVVSNPPIVPASVLIINLLTSTFLIVGYRLMVKYWYRKSLARGEKTRVLIYGGELFASQLKTNIEHTIDNNYKVIGFVDDDPQLLGKSIDNVNIYSLEQVKPLLKVWNVDMILFAKPNMDLDIKNRVVDLSLENNIQVRDIPPINQWIHGQLNMNQLKEINIEELLGRPPIEIANTQMQSLLAKRRILVTGAAGSIGSEVARQVTALKPPMVILCDQNETGLYELEYELKTKFPTIDIITLFIGDVRDENTMESLFRRFRPEIVFHAAAYKHVPMMEYHPCEAIRNNVLGTKVLADLSIEYGVERFLLVSTDKAINPTNVMGASKRIAEIYVQSLGNRNRKVRHLHEHHKEGQSTKFITTRFGNVLGSNGSVIPRFKEQIQAGGPVTVTHPEIIRYFMTIPEACNLLLEAITMGNGGEVFLFDMGEPVKIIDLARKMIKLAGFIPNQDIDIKFTGLRPGEKLFEELLNKKEEVVPTHNKKILIAKTVEYDFYEVNKAIDALMQEAFQNKDENVVMQMKSIVPEYISKNSVYQSLDEMVRESAISAN